MRRTYSQERYLDLVDKIRTAIPNIALSTDIIVGFPGETEEEFLETAKVVEQVKFDGAYTFIFSPRSGTEAAGMEDLPAAEKQRRLEYLIEIVRRVAQERHERHVGSIQEVLVEGTSKRGDRLRGRTRQNVTVNFTGSALPGSYVDVEITRATSETLLGREATPALT
jgi:tRNA-2-methylthio-N6-dimethylallyladenosine synthase